MLRPKIELRHDLVLRGAHAAKLHGPVPPIERAIQNGSEVFGPHHCTIDLGYGGRTLSRSTHCAPTTPVAAYSGATGLHLCHLFGLDRIDRLRAQSVPVRMHLREVGTPHDDRRGRRARNRCARSRGDGRLQGPARWGRTLALTRSIAASTNLRGSNRFFEMAEWQMLSLVSCGSRGFSSLPRARSSYRRTPRRSLHAARRPLVPLQSGPASPPPRPRLAPRTLSKGRGA